MSTKIVALFNLKPGVSVEDYEAWAKTKDIPTVNGLQSVDEFAVFKSTALLGSDDKPPYAYIETIDVNDMYDAAIAWTPNVLGPTFGENRPPEPKQMRSFGGSALTNLYETADREYLSFAGPEIKFATNLLNALERPDLIDVAKLPPGPGQAPLRAFFADTFKSRSLAEWQAFLEPIDCAWAWVRDLKAAFEDPFTAERGMHTTSGTTGTPQVLLFGAKSREAQNLLLGRLYRFQGLRPDDVVHSVYGHGMS